MSAAHGREDVGHRKAKIIKLHEKTRCPARAANANAAAARKIIKACDGSHATAAVDDCSESTAARRRWLRELRLLVVDSAFGALLAEHSGETKSAGGAQQARLAALLRELASRHRLAVLITNASSVDGRGGIGAPYPGGGG